jgi:hypothetical protein
MKIDLELTVSEAIEIYREIASKCNTPAAVKLRKALTHELTKARIRED